MPKHPEAVISAVEAAYDLRTSDDDWLPRVPEASLPFLDRGLGAGGLVALKPPTPGPFAIESAHVASGPPDLLLRHFAATSSVSQERVHAQTRSGPWILSELTAEHPEMLETWQSHFDGARDAVGVIALDTDGYGIQILAPSPEVVRVKDAERILWRMLAAHLSSGLRLRRALSTLEQPSSSGLPHGAEAVIRPKDFRITDALPGGPSATALESLREAAVQIDQARNERQRDENPHTALKAWWALVRGRHSMVDWFDTDGRRYILAIPNPPNVVDIRGLTKRETTVVQYAALGDNHKTIAYRLGIHRTTVTKALQSAMRKLGVKTQAELVAKLAPMPRE